MIHYSSCFNPFQGFGGVSADQKGITLPGKVIGFQSLSGFWWGFCLAEQLTGKYGKIVVSIPFRVLVGFLQGKDEQPRTQEKACFNPFQGFGGVSASAPFSRMVSAISLRFNPFQGFGGVSARRMG